MTISFLKKYSLYKMRVTFLLSLLFFSTVVIAQVKESDYPLIPMPASIKAGEGSFIITAGTKVVSTGTHFKTEVNLLCNLFATSFGKPLSSSRTATDKSINIDYDASIKAEEGYKITITSKAVSLFAKNGAGMFMAVQTIRQLLPPSVESKNNKTVTSLHLPAVTIEDEPVYTWRGIHLDVSRHFFSINYLEKLLNVMSLYKFNKFHLHLTDDQGWRIEIKKYPKLTSQGAWRTFNNQDSICMEKSKDNPDFVIDKKHIIQKNGKTYYGGFYTQQQLKELVKYAADRHIEIIPEIDMPGHMMAAIHAYPFLSGDGKSEFGELFTTPICPCLPTTFEFAENVFKEVMDIFPSKYIHIGGDEVDRTHWEKTAACKKLMEQEGFKTTAELQSWFIKKMEKFFTANGRQLIGWDEILDGGISSTALIMYWRTWVPQAPVEAIKNGNAVIMTPGSPLYFDYQPDKNSLPAVYNFNPVPSNVKEADRKFILGAQANLWAEQIPSEKRADYLYMPRMTALAERVWTNQSNYASYIKRLNYHYPRLDILKFNYRIPDLNVLESYAFTNNTTLSVDKPLSNLAIKYTTDGTMPVSKSKIVNSPLQVNQSTFIRLAAFKPDGTRSDIYDIQFTKQAMASPAHVANLTSGLNCSWYKKQYATTTLIAADKPGGIAIVPGIVVPEEGKAPSFALQYRGYIEVPDNGVYTFFLTSDDASMLYIADRKVVDNDGMHSAKEKNGQIVLAKGPHAFALDFIEGGGGYTLKLQYSKNGEAPQDIPANWFKH